MRFLFNIEKLDTFKPRRYLPCECLTCGKPFLWPVSKIRDYLNNPSIGCKHGDFSSLEKHNCANCGSETTIPVSQRSKTGRQFCSRKCSAIYNNKIKTIGTSKHKGKKKTIPCRICGIPTLTGWTSHSGICSECKKSYKYTQIYNSQNSRKKDLLCKNCKTEPVNGQYAKYCADCRLTIQSNIGRKSAQTQAEKRRSWSEIELGKLCQNHFKNVSFNEAIFPNNPPTDTCWDADILLHDEKIAILWNGPWHYQEISDKVSLARIQNRDKIKEKCIRNHGWEVFIVEDRKGKKNKKFVEGEFERLVRGIG